MTVWQKIYINETECLPTQTTSTKYTHLQRPLINNYSLAIDIT